MDQAGEHEIADALSMAAEIQRDASRVGFDWPDVWGVMEKVEEELLELREALNEGDIEHARTELGDLLFSAVNLSRFIAADPAEELSFSTARFQERFASLKKELSRQGRLIESCTLAELDMVWEAVKRGDSTGGKKS